MSLIASQPNCTPEGPERARRKAVPIWLPAVPTKTSPAAKKKPFRLRRLLAKGRSLAMRYTRELILGLGTVAFGLSVLISSSGGASVRPDNAQGDNAKATGVLAARPKKGQGAGTNMEWDEAPDPARDLVLKITTCEFANREDIATGRFLRNFDAHARELTALDLKGMKLLDRGENWVRIEATWNAASVPSVRRRETVRLRMVESKGSWKVEHFKVVPSKGKA